MTVLFLLFHIETRVSLLPLTKFSTAHSDPFNNSPIDFKLTRTRYRTENFPCCVRKGVTKTLAFWLYSLSLSLSLAHPFFLSLDDKGLFLRRTESLSGFGQLGKVIWGPNWCAQDSQLYLSNTGGRREGDMVAGTLFLVNGSLFHRRSLEMSNTVHGCCCTGRMAMRKIETGAPNILTTTKSTALLHHVQFYWRWEYMQITSLWVIKSRLCMNTIHHADGGVGSLHRHESIHSMTGWAQSLTEK